MPSSVNLNGNATWYDERGQGDPLVLLHGGMSDARTFMSNIDALAEHFHLFLPERRGHGHTADVDGPITYQVMAEDTVRFLEEVVNEPAALLGHSDGAVVALLVAAQRPDLVGRVISVSGNFHHEGLTPGFLNAEDLSHLIEPVYAEESPDGVEHLPVVTAKLARLWAEEPTLTLDDLHDIHPEILIMAGDDDAVLPEHTLALFQALPHAELAIVPGTSHALLFEKPELCHRLFLEFLSGGPSTTYLPIRRARGSRPWLSESP